MTTPEVDMDIDIEIEDKDLRIDPVPGIRPRQAT